MKPFASNELPLHPSLNDSMKKWIPNYKEPDHASETGYIRTFQISNRPFVGLDVPASCIVQLYEVRGLEMHLNSARYEKPFYRIRNILVEEEVLQWKWNGIGVYGIRFGAFNVFGSWIFKL